VIVTLFKFRPFASRRASSGENTIEAKSKTGHRFVASNVMLVVLPVQAWLLAATGSETALPTASASVGGRTLRPVASTVQPPAEAAQATHESPSGMGLPPSGASSVCARAIEVDQAKAITNRAGRMRASLIASGSFTP
jgi:hypothetical protein